MVGGGGVLGGGGRLGSGGSDNAYYAAGGGSGIDQDDLVDPATRMLQQAALERQVRPYVPYVAAHQKSYMINIHRGIYRCIMCCLCTPSDVEIFMYVPCVSRVTFFMYAAYVSFSLLFTSLS